MMMLATFVTLQIASAAVPAADAVPRTAEVAHGRLVREHTIQVSNGVPFYAPATVTIRAGESVHWRSSGPSDTHSVREALHGTFSLEIPPGAEVSHHFKRTGEYQYRCRYHPWMVGRIVVEPKRLAIQWQPFPEKLRNGRFVAAENHVFVVGDGAQPEIAQLAHGDVIPLGALGRRIRPDVTPGVDSEGSLWFLGEARGTLVRFSPLTRDATAYATLPAATVLTALSPASDGSVWFHDRASGRLGQFVPATDKVKWLSVRGLNETLTAIRAAPDGLLWLLDRTGRVGRLDPTQTVAEISWTSAGVSALAVSRDAVWMVSAAREKILRVDGTGTVVEFTVPPAIGNPRTLAPAGEGVWILKDGGQIARLAEGEIEEYALSLPSRAADMVAGRDADLWLLDPADHRIGHVAAEVRTVAQLP